MASESTVMNEIRTHYRSAYEEKAEKLLPWRNKICRGLHKGGTFSMIGGALSMVSAGAMACFSAPFVLPVLIGGGALFYLGLLGRRSGNKLYARIPETGMELLEQDITNLKLVKSYVKDALPEKTTALQRGREEAVKAHDRNLKGMAEHSEHLKDSRRAALLIIRKGMDLLEQQFEASRQEVDFFRNEAQTLGVEFAAAVQKPHTADAAPVAANGPAASPSVPSKAI